MEDILWSKDIEDIVDSWIDKGFSKEDAEIMTDTMTRIERNE